MAFYQFELSLKSTETTCKVSFLGTGSGEKNLPSFSAIHRLTVFLGDSPPHPPPSISIILNLSDSSLNQRRYSPVANLNLKLNQSSSQARFRISASSPSSSLTPQLRDTLEKLVNSEKVILFMKGTRDLPMCGFSNTVVQILKNLNVPFEDVNILENDLLRQRLKE
ncbi:unnamed protein product [Cochlearia groenlandica]